MPAVTRRTFLAAAPLLAAPRWGAAADPSALPLSVAAYGFRQALDLKKPTMTLFDFIDKAAGWPVTAVELTSYFFADTTDAYIDKLKAHCAARKLAVSGLPIRTNFGLTDAGKLRAEVAACKAWIDRAARLGAPTLRVFAGTVAKGDDPAAALKRVVASLQDCAAHAAMRNVKLGLENHDGPTGTGKKLVDMIKAIGNPALGANLDTGNFRTPDPYADMAEAAPVAVSVQVKSDLTPTGQPTRATDYGKVVALLKRANYRGHVTLEYEGKGEPTTAVPAELAALKKALDA